MSQLEDAHLKRVIVSILRTDTALHMVNFTFAKFTIGTMFFHTLTGFMDIGRCKCSVDPAGITTGAAAEYDPSSNTIIAKNSRLLYFDDKVSLVHEATHAVIDLLGGLNKMTVTSLETETCAYIAGAMYKLATQQAQKNPGVTMTVNSNDKNIHYEADKLVKGKGLGTGSTNAGNPISFSLPEVAALQSAIKSNPLYTGWKSKTVTDGM
jgi:hypothetical protein